MHTQNVKKIGKKILGEKLSYSIRQLIYERLPIGFDYIFLSILNLSKHFKDKKFKYLLGIEPAKNLANLANKNGIKTYNGFLDQKSFSEIWIMHLFNSIQIFYEKQ